MNYEEEDNLWSRYSRADEPGSLFDPYEAPEDDEPPVRRGRRPAKRKQLPRCAAPDIGDSP